MPNGWEGPRYYAAQLAPETVRTDWTTPAAKAGIVPPRPLELGDIFGGAFRAVRFAPLTMFGLTLAVLMIAQLLGLGLGWVLARQFGESVIPGEGVDIETMSVLSWSSVVAILANSLTSIVVGMGLTYTVFQAVSARRVTPVEALQRMGARLWAALAYSAVTGLAIAVAAGLGFAVLTPLFSGSNEVRLVAVVPLLILPAGILATWIGTKLLLAPCAIAIEGLGPFRAIRRSWQLTRGLFWRLLGINLLASVIISLASSTVGTVFTFAGSLLSLQDADLAFLAMTTLSTLASTMLSLPLMNAVTALLYIDARIRREGFDLQLSEALYG